MKVELQELYMYLKKRFIDLNSSVLIQISYVLTNDLKNLSNSRKNLDALVEVQIIIKY